MATTSKDYRMGNPRGACYLRKGDQILVTLPAGCDRWFAADNLRDSTPVTITNITYTRIGRRRAYQFTAITDDGTEIVTKAFYGQNTLKAPMPR